jgi:serine/threonine-protein kinase
LNHRAIVDVFDVAQAEDGRAFIVMELLSGESLETRIERGGPLNSLETATALSQVADGLDAAHRAGIVHRDLSSANIFLARNPDGGAPIAKILDFGVSKTLGPARHDRTQTGNGAVLGCPEFMSPEQARGAEAVDARTDVWSLGIVLYQCLAGAAPFRAQNYNALMVAILTRPHRPLLEVSPAVDRELAEIVEGCLAKERDARIQTASEVRERLSAIVRRLAGSAAVPTSPQRRATDRLPRSRSEQKAPQSALAQEDLQALDRLRTRRRVVGLVSAAVGVGAGALIALAYGSWPKPDTALIPVAHVIAKGKPPAPPVLKVPREFAPPPPSATSSDQRASVSPKPSEPLPPDDESRLAVAVARGLGVGTKSVSEH